MTTEQIYIEYFAMKYMERLKKGEPLDTEVYEDPEFDDWDKATDSTGQYEDI